LALLESGGHENVLGGLPKERGRKEGAE
jgi:hypothetical protein